MRRQFHLPEKDADYLESRGFEWETVIEANAQWLIIKKYGIPDGYNVTATSIAVRIDAGYPTSQIDMVYFLAALQRRDSKPIGALTAVTIDGRTWQQWSRHRTAENPWRPGVDDLSTHLLLIDYLLEREFKIR